MAKEVVRILQTRAILATAGTFKSLVAVITACLSAILTQWSAMVSDPNHNQLIGQAYKELGFIQKDLPDFFGVSLRTVQRYGHTYGISSFRDYAKLVQALYPRNPALAAQIAAMVGKSLSDLGVQLPPPPDPAPLPPPRATLVHAEAVLCAAADAVGLVPRDVRPIVAAIFSRVRALDVDLPSLTALLAELSSAPAKTSNSAK
jgi:hypothetical protein